MSLQPLDWTILAAYALFLLYLSLRAGKGETSDIESYLLAGRRLTLPSFIATTVSTWYGGILGVGEYSYKYGLSNWLVFGVPYYLAAFIFAIWLAGRASKARLLTIPDQIEAVYGPRLAVGSALYIFVMTVPAAYVLMLGILLKLLFGWTLTTGVIVGTAATTGYVFLGGFKSDVRSDWVQFVLMFLSFAVLLVILVAGNGGLDFLLGHVPPAHFQWHGGNSGGYIFSWYLIALAALIEPSFYQRAYAAKSPSVARAGILLSIPFWVVFDFMTTSVGIYSRALLGPGVNGVDAYPLLADRVLPAGLKALFIVGLVATIQSTVDSYSLLAASSLSHDILWKARRVRRWISEVWLTRVGLIVGSALSIWIALTTESVVDIWNRLGSLGTPGLMLPLALSYSPRFRYRAVWAAANMVIAPAVVGLWFVVRGRVKPAPFPFSVEPIYVGMSVALLLLGLDHQTRRRKGV